MARSTTHWTVDSLLDHTTDDAGCAIWQGRMHQQTSVPMVNQDGEPRMVRRLLLTMLGRALEPTDFVGCRCNTPGCIHPEHLVVKTKRRHMAEAATSPRRNETLRRARIAATRQARHARLTPEQVAMVRTSPLSGAELARQLGVSRSLTNRIRSGKAWAVRGNPWQGMGAR